MYLKRLDIVGFKSFADRISIDFDKGVTAVVGPNGSGKSNITDAVRWVLGEQSVKSLRGSKMEDIIFGGSDSRKALNVAEVTLTLDNEDNALPLEYNEVSVTRRVYRSGDSDFFINKQNCRLKDIVDLFMDSGLGKEAFSIISQGKVEEILSSKPEDRRGIFEEAAGVLKYKTRKKKAEVKLSETQDNLNRVEDILHELEGQIEPLKIQASLAKEYLEKKEELEQVEAALIVYEIEELHAKWEKLKEEFEAHGLKELEVSASLQKNEAMVVDYREKIQVIDESIQSLQEVLLLTSNDIEKLEGQKELLKERKKNAASYSLQLKQKIEELTGTTKQLSETRLEEESELQLLKKEIKGLQHVLCEKETGLLFDEKALEEQIDNVKADYIEKLNQQASFRNELSMLQEQLNQYGAKNARLDDENAKYLVLRQQFQQQKETLDEQLEKLVKELEAAQADLQKLQVKQETTKEEYSKKETLLYQAYQYMQQTKSRKEMLEEMQDDYAGFYQGVKEVLKAKETLPGIEGAVAELITVPKEYEVAVETALGAAMQHVVVDNEANARQAIGYLKQNRYGRATFLPLSVMKGKSFPFDQLNYVKQHPSFVGIASDLLVFDAKYTNIVTNLLGTVIVTNDLKGANELARQLSYRYRFVTLEGDIVNPGGSMTGGAVKQNKTSLLSRQRELEDVTEKLQDMVKKTTDLEQYVKDLKVNLQANDEALFEKREHVQSLRLQEQRLLSELKQVDVEAKGVNDRLSLYDLEMADFAEERVKMENRITFLKKSLEESTELITKLDAEVQLLTKQKAEKQLSKETLQLEVTELKVKVAEKQQIATNQDEKVTRLKEQHELQVKELETARENLELLQTDVTTNEHGETTVEETLRKKKHDKEQTLELITSRRQERLELGKQVEDVENELKETKRQHKFLLDTLKDEEVQINRLDVELDNRLHHLQEAYELSYDAAKVKYPMVLEVHEARKRVKLIKMSIEELGTVNLGAIDEYERVSERYTFLMEQRTDLREAKDTLHQVISEMDEEMKKRFQHMFSSIRAEFGQVFAELFGGGRADLQLTDSDDLLNTGIEIVAQPPGKKLQNLGLLSGGERALTAIALLFSILKVRPVPFCILDEVEAALDEANVARFAQYLKRFSAETQFIVITHRKGTMEESDVLYGVTMQESGVSKLVSVRLDEQEEVGV
ncbi:chromosome segregation protein SMC [Priestia taiwanensis]|uniref:Chromosome partition protein Smc n=1 Tax=Priestia taiwanensis TaxID=1347902 RepID=A0A917AQQ8_9BACI|nr:chromosome segregation protein SMC [Priestia taiwanensis]MBM7362870.1 chromosome segregation protein [Priestia taiwanensis]GGE65804.1 chromosome partition protein Smc [Priestia taiwanensis]